MSATTGSTGWSLRGFRAALLGSAAMIPFRLLDETAFEVVLLLATLAGGIAWGQRVAGKALLGDDADTFLITLAVLLGGLSAVSALYYRFLSPFQH